MEMARALGSDVMSHLARGYVPGSSGEILLIPKPWNVIGQWNDGLRGEQDPRTSHATPWDYHQRVPITLYGPGFVRAGVRPTRAVDVADLAPTFAELLDFEFRAPDGQVLREALVPRAQRRRPPAVIVLVAYDGGGWNVLEQWPHAWPAQRRLASLGTTYTNATIGSAPSVTAPVHATMGTGAYPRVHGLAENTARLPDGSTGDVYLERADPALLRSETLADAWDRSSENRAWVGMLGYESWHLGMMGHGAGRDGGDRDAAVLWDRDAEQFWTNEELYTLPDYLPGRDLLDAHIRELDASDGALDGAWRGNVLAENAYLFTGTPAFARYQGDAVLKMVRREPIGKDRVTDLLFVELKPTDIAGHVWNMLSEEEEALLQTQDRILSDLVALLDRKVGQGRYVLAITADHGQTPTPEANGGLRVDRYALGDDINAHFGATIVQAVHPSEVYLDLQAVRDAGIRLEDVARFIGSYRYGEGLPEGIDWDTLSRSVRQEQVMAAALPGPFVESLTPEQIRALGPGRYPEGILNSPLAVDPLSVRR
jgi:Type I phosphodiesterase / nucleotide pyrophosphatase